MKFMLSKKSITKLNGVHDDLIQVVTRAIEITEVDFVVLEGLRTLDKQKMLLQAGATTTLNSRHLTGHAVDLGALIGGEVRWDWSLYHKIAYAMKEAAKDLDIPIEWGGDWKTFPDGAHFQLPFSVYPKPEK